MCASLISFGQLPDRGLVHPMDLPVEVAGNFMELRTNHFHSGLDLKTNGRIGQPVRSAGDGWVSRIESIRGDMVKRSTSIILQDTPRYMVIWTA